MVLSRTTVCNLFTVYKPRWHDRQALLKNNRIVTHNQIVFPNAPTMAGDWYISGEKARTFPTMEMKRRAGGYVTMRVIPLDELEILERA